MTAERVKALEAKLTESENTFKNIIESSDIIGSFDDNKQFRYKLQKDIETTVANVANLKKEYNELAEQNVANLDSSAERMANLSNSMRTNFPALMKRLKVTHERSQQVVAMEKKDPRSISLMDQEQIEEETQQIEMLETEVADILSSLKEINDLFRRVYEEIESRRHILVAIDQKTEAAIDDLAAGNELIDRADEHRGKIKKTLVLVISVLVLIVLAVVGFIIYNFTQDEEE